MLKINEWQIYPDTCTLIREGKSSSENEEATEEKRISPRSMDVLVYLVERQGEVVSTEELLDKFWASSSITDHAIHKIVAALRSALGDIAASPRFIKTLPKRGYCLIAEVIRTDNLPTVSEPFEQPAPEIKVAVQGARLSSHVSLITGSLTLAIVLVMVIVLVAQAVRQDSSLAIAPELVANTTDSGSVRIAIISPQSNDTSTELQMIQVLLDSLSVNLARVEGLDVVASSNRVKDVAEAEKFGASHALTSSLFTTGEELRLTMSLISISDGITLYANHFSLQKDDLLTIEEEVIPTVVESLSIHLDEDRYQEMLAWGTRDASAYQYFLKAGFYNSQYNHQDWELAMDYYERAITQDPLFLNAYLGKATAANNMSVYSRQGQVLKLSSEVLDLSRRLALAVPDSNALETLSAVRLRIEGLNQWQQEQKYREQIKDGNAPGYVYARYALFLIGVRMYVEANAFLDLASRSDTHQITPNEAWNFTTQTLPPVELAEIKVKQLIERPVHIGILGTAISSLAYTGDIDRAEAYYRRQLERDMDGVRSHLSHIILETVSGKIAQPDYSGDLFSEHLLQDPDLAFNNGALYFMMEDFESGAMYWRHLTPGDTRKLYTRLHDLEKFFPGDILNNPQYGVLLEEIGIGLSWQQQIMNGVVEMSEHTGIQLSPVSRAYLDRGELMLKNNLWAEHDCAFPERVPDGAQNIHPGLCTPIAKRMDH